MHSASSRLRGPLTVIAAAMAALSACASSEPADLIVHNGRVYTMDAANPQAAAVAMRGDRIVFVGSDADVLALRGDATRVIDARQGAVVPGLHDAHGHFVELGEALEVVDLRGAASYDEAIARVRERAASMPAGEWVTGRGWDQNDWPGGAFPTHEALSAATPDHPVYLARVDGHAGLANARAMAAAGVTAATPDPDGGRLLRGAGGAPTGVFVDRAEGLVTAHIPPPSSARREAQARLADETAARLGLIWVHDAGSDGATVDLYKRLIDGGQLRTRLYVMRSGTLDDLAPAFAAGPIADYGGHRLAVRAIKIVADGALGSRGAALLEPYADEPDTSGLLVTPPETVYAQTLAASRAGFQTAIHAIGDRANRLVLDVFERVQREVPGARDLRLRLEHAQILDAAEIPRVARLGVIASMQPTHATSDMPWVPDRIGARRMREGAYVWRRLLDAGARIAAGSDFPVELADPLHGFYAAVTRQDRDGQPPGGWMPEERLTREQALRAFTLDAAYAAHADTVAGSLEAGKLADLVVFSRDIMTVPAPQILETTVRATVTGGQVVWESSD